MEMDLSLKLAGNRIPFRGIAQVCKLSKLAIINRSSACDDMVNEGEVQSPLQSYRAIELEGVHKLPFNICKIIFDGDIVCPRLGSIDWTQLLLKTLPMFVLRIERGIFGIAWVTRYGFF